MGTGKSAVSRELAHMTGYRAVDVDHEIEKSAGRSIADIFGTEGEPAFRDMEHKALVGIASGSGQVISTGGGAVMRDDNLSVMCSGGRNIIVSLTASPETVYERTKGNSERPLLNVPDPMGRIRELMELRMPRYMMADVIVSTDGKSPQDVALEILEAIGWKRSA